jgi:citrate lyase subunit beta/citryl-CoA lyase
VTLLRSWLFIPGNRANMLEKAFVSSADAIVPDMEDSVPEAEKTAACDLIAEFLPRLRTTGKFICPRVNSLQSGRTRSELAAVVGPHIDAVSIGKVRSAGDISAISQLIGALERERAMPLGTIGLVPWIETAGAIVECHAICKASRRIVAVAFGAEDFTHDMGIEHVDDESNLAFARASMCVAARAAGVTALDTPYFRFRDIEGLSAHSRRSRHFGFGGRFAIHPAQTDTINECFAPSSAEIERARRIVAAYENAEKHGRASTSLDGLVIDVPVVRRARALLALAESLGL